MAERQREECLARTLAPERSSANEAVCRRSTRRLLPSVHERGANGTEKRGFTGLPNDASDASQVGTQSEQTHDERCVCHEMSAADGSVHDGAQP